MGTVRYSTQPEPPTHTPGIFKTIIISVRGTTKPNRRLVTAPVGTNHFILASEHGTKRGWWVEWDWNEVERVWF